jgi:hypothetical protein
VVIGDDDVDVVAVGAEDVGGVIAGVVLGRSPGPPLLR